MIQSNVDDRFDVLIRVENIVIVSKVLITGKIQRTV